MSSGVRVEDGWGRWGLLRVVLCVLRSVWWISDSNMLARCIPVYKSLGTYVH